MRTGRGAWGGRAALLGMRRVRARTSWRRPRARPHFSACAGCGTALLGIRRVRARTSRHPSSSAGRRAPDARTRRHLSRRAAHPSPLCARTARTRCPHSRVRALGARRLAPSARPDGATPASAPCGRRQDAKLAFSPWEFGHALPGMVPMDIEIDVPLYPMRHGPARRPVFLWTEGRFCMWRAGNKDCRPIMHRTGRPPNGAVAGRDGVATGRREGRHRTSPTTMPYGTESAVRRADSVPYGIFGLGQARRPRCRDGRGGPGVNPRAAPRQTLSARVTPRRGASAARRPRRG